MTNSTESQSDRKELKKTMSPAEVWALAVGAIIGWGCFVLPGTRFLPEAGPLGTCIAFALGGGLLCTVALCYSILIKVYPVAGGSFTYAYVGFGTRAGFVCGWALVLGYLCVIAANGTALALLSRFVLPGVFDVGYMYSVAGWDVYAGELAMMSAFFLFFGYMNFRGMDFASSLQLILAFALAAACSCWPVGWRPRIRPASTTSPAAPVRRRPDPVGLRDLHRRDHPVAVRGLLTPSRRPPRNSTSARKVPPPDDQLPSSAARPCTRAGVLSVAVVMPYPDLARPEPAGPRARSRTWPSAGSGGAIRRPGHGGHLPGMNGFFMATTRLLFSMGRQIPASVVRQGPPQVRTPTNAVLFTLCLTLIAPWFGRSALNWIVDMSAMGTALAYLFTCMTA